MPGAIKEQKPEGVRLCSPLPIVVLSRTLILFPSLRFQFFPICIPNTWWRGILDGGDGSSDGNTWRLKAKSTVALPDPVSSRALLQLR